MNAKMILAVFSMLFATAACGGGVEIDADGDESSGVGGGSVASSSVTSSATTGGMGGSIESPALIVSLADDSPEKSTAYRDQQGKVALKFCLTASVEVEAVYVDSLYVTHEGAAQDIAGIGIQSSSMALPATALDAQNGVLFQPSMGFASGEADCVSVKINLDAPITSEDNEHTVALMGSGSVQLKDGALVGGDFPVVSQAFTVSAELTP